MGSLKYDGQNKMLNKGEEKTEEISYKVKQKDKNGKQDKDFIFKK